MNIRAAIIFPGYVESTSVGGVPFFSEAGSFTSAQELLEDLGFAICRAYLDDEAGVQSACCAANPEAKFCPECGKRNAPSPTPTVDDLSEFTRHFLRGTCDSIGGRIWEEIESEGWIYGPAALQAVLQDDVILFVHQSGSEVLARGHLRLLREEDDEYGSWLSRHAEIIGRPGVEGTWKLLKD